MKKFVKANARIILGIIAVVIVFCVCAVACGNDSTANNNTENLSQGNIEITEGEENSDAQESTDSEVIANDAELKNDVDDLSKELEAALKENEALKAENAELKKENSSFEDQINSAVEVIDGVVYCDVDYFLYRTTVKFADDTAALMAINSGTPVVLDDVHAIGETAGYRDETFELPREGYNLAVTFDGKEVQIADFGNYHWASRSLFLKSTATTGYNLVETYKSSSMGNFDLLLQIVAVCVENPEAEYGYDFYVAANYNDPNPVVSEPETQPECPKDETDNETNEPEDPEDPEDPKDPETPENNPPIDEPVIPDEPVVPGEPENNPPLDETEDVPEGEGPEDMTEGPEDMENGSSDDNNNNDNSGNNPPEQENNDSDDDDVANNPPADGGSDDEGPADMQ